MLVFSNFFGKCKTFIKSAKVIAIFGDLHAGEYLYRDMEIVDSISLLVRGSARFGEMVGINYSIENSGHKSNVSHFRSRIKTATWRALGNPAQFSLNHKDPHVRIRLFSFLSLVTS